MSFLEYLLQQGVITQEESIEILRKKEEENASVVVEVYKLGKEKDVIESFIEKFYGLPHGVVNEEEVSPDIMQLIPEEAARHYYMVPLRRKVNGVMEIGIVDPENAVAKNVLDFIFSQSGTAYVVSFISLTEFNELVDRYGSIHDAVSSVEDVVDEDQVSGTLADDENAAESLEEIVSRSEKAKPEEKDEKITESAPITKMVASILLKAIDDRASDIHIERSRNNTKVRYRIDGTLETALTLPKTVHGAIIARIKIITKLKLDEKRKPQDGRFPAKIKGRTVDFRVSTMPTFYGEKAVIRILDPETGIKTLDDTGMTPEHLETIRKALKRPYGIILICGPTGSGKSTTLYGMLSEVDRDGSNVVSLEDPVEYSIDGVSQSQVHPEIGYTFANGLRSILRQDPDVIMVGEIRDAETAQLAIQAALTGHMVLSTLHTNSSLGVVPRLIDMGIDPYLIAPTLTLAIAQRLVRRIAPEAGEAIPESESYRSMITKQFDDLPAEYKSKLDLTKMPYEAHPTPTAPMGTKGRIAVYEMFEIDKDIEHIILQRPSEMDMYKAARAKGMLTMKEDALIKSMQGLLPMEDVNTL
ncbi:MAG TPA: GspE/PulE family protein [Candidatus Paceibacterota bacterium]